MGRLLPPVTNYLASTLNVPELDAEECASDALYSAYKKISSFRPGNAKLTTWIFKIAKNRAIDFHRQCRVHSVSLEEIGEIVRPPEKTECAGLNKALLDELRVKLEALPQQDRDILLWRADDCSYADIAGWLGIKEPTARVRHLRAMKKVNVTLEQSQENEIATEREVSEDE
jgi:RNA polymerase sigma factor (sigma-70 family)